MNDHYQVKWTTRDAVTHYGFVYPTYAHTPASEIPPEGMLYVEDAIYPVQHLVAEADVIDIPLDDYPNELDTYIENECKKAETASRLLGAGILPGKVFSIGVGDGYAAYVVTKVNRANAVVEWRGFGGADRYTDRVLGWGGTFPKSSLKHLIF